MSLYLIPLTCLSQFKPILFCDLTNYKSASFGLFGITCQEILSYLSRFVFSLLNQSCTLSCLLLLGANEFCVLHMVFFGIMILFVSFGLPGLYVFESRSESVLEIICLIVNGSFESTLDWYFEWVLPKVFYLLFLNSLEIVSLII